MDKNKKNIKNHRFEFRMNDEEYCKFVEHSKNYNSSVSFIRAAISQFDNNAARNKYTLMDKLYFLMNKYDSNFAHIGANLNQCMHRINDLNVRGALNAERLNDEIAPQLYSLLIAIDELLIEIHEIYKKATEV